MYRTRSYRSRGRGRDSCLPGRDRVANSRNRRTGLGLIGRGSIGRRENASVEASVEVEVEVKVKVGWIASACML